jgi:hypothetical protein
MYLFMEPKGLHLGVPIKGQIVMCDMGWWLHTFRHTQMRLDNLL